MLSFFGATFSDIVLYALTTIFAIIGSLTGIAAKGLNMAIFVRPGSNLLVVDTTWKILRDFSNMIFIVLLIYMAFATIFDQGKYTFKDMIVRFVIVAVLINFSLVIGNLIIDGSQVLTNIFLGSIGNLGDRLGQFLNPSLLLPNAADLAKLKGADITMAALVSIVFAIILSLIFLFSILVALVFAIIRTPIIWALLIVSPLAWMSHILPSSEGWWKKWWSQFWGWNLFLPVYLFFMYLGLLFLSQRDVIMGAVIQANTSAGNPANAPLLEGLGNSLSFNLLFFYLFAAFVMYGSTWAATKTTSLMGSGFEKGVGWAKWAVKNFPTPGVGSLQNYQNAVKQRGEQFKREGVLGYFGTEKADRKTAAIAGNRLLFGGVRDVKDKQLGSDVGTWKSRFSNLDTNQLRQQMNSGPVHQQLAMRELLKERGQLSNNELEETYDLYEKTSPPSAIKFAGSIDYGKISSTERDSWLNKTTNIELRKKIVGVMADKGDLTDIANIQRATGLFALNTDKADLIKKAGRRITDTSILRPLMNTGSDEEKLAVRQILTDRNQLTGQELLETYNMFEDGTQAAQDFGKKLDFKNFKKAERRTWFDSIADVDVKRKIAEVMVDKGELEGEDPLHPGSGVVLSGGDWLEASAKALYANGAEKIDFIQKTEGEKFMASIEAKSRLAAAGEIEIKLRGAPVTSIPDVLEARVSRMKAEDLAKVDRDSWGVGLPTGVNSAFYDAVKAKIQARQIAEPPVAAAMGATGAPIPPKLGGGDILKANILKEVGDAGKAAIINTITP